MMAFTDTSALYALLARQTTEHAAVRRAFVDLTRTGRLVTHGYVVLETITLLQRRFGLTPVAVFIAEILPVIDVHPVDPALHQTGLADLLASGVRSVSLVDRVSFAFMRAHGIRTALTLDADFASEGFEVRPS